MGEKTKLSNTEFLPSCGGWKLNSAEGPVQGEENEAQVAGSVCILVWLNREFPWMGFWILKNWKWEVKIPLKHQFSYQFA